MGIDNVGAWSPSPFEASMSSNYLEKWYKLVVGLSALKGLLPAQIPGTLIGCATPLVVVIGDY